MTQDSMSSFHPAGESGEICKICFKTLEHLNRRKFTFTSLKVMFKNKKVEGNNFIAFHLKDFHRANDQVCYDW
jgi:hypothetical protein